MQRGRAGGRGGRKRWGGRRKDGGKKTGGTWFGLGETATHGEWPEDGRQAGAQMGSCRRPRAPPMGLDPLKALEMLEMPSCWSCSRTCRGDWGRHDRGVWAEVETHRERERWWELQRVLHLSWEPWRVGEPDPRAWGPGGHLPFEALQAQLSHSSSGVPRPNLGHPWSSPTAALPKKSSLISAASSCPPSPLQIPQPESSWTLHCTGRPPCLSVKSGSPWASQSPPHPWSSPSYNAGVIRLPLAQPYPG